LNFEQHCQSFGIRTFNVRYFGKSLEGRKFKGRFSFWTLRPTEIGRGGHKADRKKVGNFLVPVPPAGLGKGMGYWLG